MEQYLNPVEHPEKAQKQHVLAPEGMAEGQCVHCGSYRPDGLRPLVHANGCPDSSWWN